MNHHRQEAVKLWAKVKRNESHLLWRKVNRTSSLASTLYRPEYIFQYLLTNLIPSSKQFLSYVTAVLLEGLSFVCPIFLQSQGISQSTFLGDSRSLGLCPFFLQSPTPLSSTCQLNLREEPLSHTLQIIQFLLTHLPRRRLTKFDYSSSDGHLAELLHV